MSRPLGLLALDLDGTLLDTGHRVSPANHAAVLRVLNLGWPVVLATGRTYRSAQQYAALWPGHRIWIAAYNGAVLRPADQGTALAETVIPLPTAKAIATWASEQDVYLKAYVDDQLLVARANEETRSFNLIHGVPYHEVGDLAAALTKAPTKLTIIAQPAQLQQWEETLMGHWGHDLTITSSTPDSLECNATGVSKGAALRYLANWLNIEPQRVAAIGNERNDLSMITWAGFGGAVQNAPPTVQQAAGVVVPHHNESGVAAFIDAWLSKEQM